MTPEAQRIAIAEACGIHVCGGCNHQIDPECCHCGSPVKMHTRGDGHGPVPMGCVCGYDSKDVIRLEEPDCPDYLNDLNAIHEAEKVLTPEQQIEYGRQLVKHVIGLNSVMVMRETFDCVHATAAQRAEALLRTLGKWEDGK